MDRLTIFGLFAVTAMLVTYALEKRSHWFMLAFAGSCVLGSAYGFRAHGPSAWSSPFGRWWRWPGGGGKELSSPETGTEDSFRKSSMVISIEKEAYVDRRCVD